jgi:hypothetical protein
MQLSTNLQGRQGSLPNILDGFDILLLYTRRYDLILSPDPQDILPDQLADLFIGCSSSHNGFNQPRIRRHIIDPVGWGGLKKFPKSLKLTRLEP